MAPNSLFCADVRLSNYSLTPIELIDGKSQTCNIVWSQIVRRHVWCDAIFATRKLRVITLRAQHQVPLGELNVPIVCVPWAAPIRRYTITSRHRIQVKTISLKMCLY